MDGEVTERRALGSRYELVSRLGAGAMGEVWRTLDRSTGEHVAAKLLRGDLTRDPEIVGRFVQERSILLSLDHPSIVRVHDLVVEGDALAIVMDLVEGPDLGRYLRTVGTLAPRTAVEVTCAVLDALAAAHERHCLHRDVKPDNVLLAGAEPSAAVVRLSDFGIARLAQESTVQATGLLGTPGYMPPELFTDGRFSPASDVYATGVLLYELLAGRTPFSGSGTAHTVGYRHVHVEPPRLPIAPPLWDLVATMLAKDPTIRLSAAGTAAALRELPDAVLDLPALPRQETPESWEQAGTHVARRGPLHVEVESDDVGRTHLHAGEVTPDARAATGQVAAIAPVTGGVDGDVTHLGRPAPEHVRPVLESTVDRPVERPRRRWWPWVAGSTAVVAVTVGALVLTGVVGGGGDGPADGPTGQAGGPAAVSATQQATSLATGLSTGRAASWDPESETLSLTLTYGTRDTPLRGPFLEVLPAIGEGECPLVAWGGATVTQNQPLATGVDSACGWSVDPGPIASNQNVQVTAELALSADRAGEDPAATVDAWLTAVDEATTAGLARPRTGTAYAAQRLADIEVAVPPVVRRVTGGTPPLRVSVLPVWAGRQRGDRTNPMYVSTEVGEATALLTSVAGGLDGIRMDGCDALVISNDRRHVGIRSAADQCYVEVTVGDLRNETTFDIESATG